MHGGRFRWGIAALAALGGNVWAAPPGPREAYSRTRAVLDHFGVAEEDESQPQVERLAGLQTAAGLARVLPYLDPTGQFARFSASEAGGVSVFRDRDSREQLDFSVPLRPENSPPPPDPRAERWGAIAGLPPERALEGVRVALDPGHMGGERWDRLTGKFVRDGQGRRLSEGLLALQTCLLLERELRALGAEVLLTRRGLAPVTEIPYERLDVEHFARLELRQSALQGWFTALLSAGPAGPDLYRAFECAPETRQIFDERARSRYFILRADLEARARAIERFAPDLTLVIHFDTRDPPGNPNGLNPAGYSRTKAYVGGAFLADELASREDRRFFALHALDPWAWGASVRLSRHVVAALSRGLGIPIDRAGGARTKEVEPGVQARNLVLARKLTGHPLSYVEVLHYNSPAEFAALSRAEHPLEIDGANHPYSDRLREAVAALKQAVLGFAQAPTD